MRTLLGYRGYYDFFSLLEKKEMDQRLLCNQPVSRKTVLYTFNQFNCSNSTWMNANMYGLFTCQRSRPSWNMMQPCGIEKKKKREKFIRSLIIIRFIILWEGNTRIKNRDLTCYPRCVALCPIFACRRSHSYKYTCRQYINRWRRYSCRYYGCPTCPSDFGSRLKAREGFIQPKYSSSSVYQSCF